MSARASTLTAEDIGQFRDQGYVIVRGAFARDDAQAMQDEWWAELARAHGVFRDDRSTWRPIASDLRAAKFSPLQHRILTPRVRGVIDDLLGPGAWRSPEHWGRTITGFPEPGAWEVPTHLWHWDSPWDWHSRGLNALFIVSFLGDVAPGGGGTLIVAGSPRLLARHEATLTPADRRRDAAARRAQFHRSNPWLSALTGHSPSPADRIAAFMAQDSDVDGGPVRVVELTGGPGDMVVCHPCILHCAAPNRGRAPRFMRIRQQLMTHEGQAFLTGARRVG